MDGIISKKSFRRGYRWFISVFSLFGIVALFVPLNVFFSEGVNFIVLLFVILGLLFLYLVIHTIAFFLHKWSLGRKNEFFISQLGNGAKLHILFGNILGDELTKERTNIVISFNRCFDTQVDDYLIRRNSLHGQLVEKLIQSGKYTEKTLQKAIAKSLNKPSNLTYQYEEIDKSIGRRKRYELGAVAEIEGVNKEHYFCLGLSEFNQNKAEINIRGYIVVLDKLIERIIDLSQNYPVYIPLIGAGMSSLGISDELVLATLIHTILLHKSRLYCNVYIVVKPDLKYSLEKLTAYV